MKSIFKMTAIAALVLASSACTRIETGEVGVRVNMSKESERMAALAANSTQSIAFMNAQAQLKVAEGVANGKVHTVVVPYDFKGIVNAK